MAWCDPRLGGSRIQGGLVRGEPVSVDLGPKFRGWAGRTAEKIICVTPTGADDPVTRAIMRELVERMGGNCTACGNCPAGRD